MKKNKRTPARVLTGGNIARGATALSVTGLMAMMSPAHQAVAADNPYVQQFGRGNNPLYMPVGVDSRNKPALVDINNDGLVDLFIGDGDGTISYFENTGTAAEPVFSVRLDADNPFDGVDVGSYAAPTFADVDEDGLLDAVVGANDGYMYYFHNTGTVDAPEFEAMTGTDNPFNGMSVGLNSTPHFADVNSDGQVDLVVGENDGYLNYVENIGDGDFDFYSHGHPDNPFDSWLFGSQSAPAHLDSNNNGQVDTGEAIVVGQNSYFEYLQKEADGTFTRYDESDTDNPLYKVDGGYRNAPAFADLDDDGDMDMVVGNDSDEQLLYFANINSDADPVFKERTGDTSPFYGFDVGDHSQPVFVDIDGDGDMDAFSVADGSNSYIGVAAKIAVDSEEVLKFYENTGTAQNPQFVERSGVGNPLDGVTPAGSEGSDGELAFVAFADIDGDGDMDAFVGSIGESYSFSYSPITGPTYTMERTGTITFYENTGNATSPVFEQKGDADNPLFFVEDPNYDLAFVDIDGDGDLDAFGGGTNFSMTYSGGEYSGGESLTMEGAINFYENKGDNENPAFAPGNTNPLGFVFGSDDSVYSSCYSLAFGDIDGDGDLDAVVGKSEYTFSKYSDPSTLNLFENVGSATDPSFAPVAEVNDTFAKLNEQSHYEQLTPVMVDIDDDGDMDIFAGERYGRFLYFKNTSQRPAADTNLFSSSGGGSSSIDSGCFIETTKARASGGNWLTQTVSRAWTGLTALLR